MIVSCAGPRAPSEDLLVPVAFEINGTFVVSMELPQAETQNIFDSAAFIAVGKSNSQQLFQAMYDPGRGENKGILLTRIWATVHRYSGSKEPGMDDHFERAKLLMTVGDPDSLRNHSFDEIESIGGRDWLPVKLKKGLSSGMAFITEVNEEYAVIVGARVFNNDSNATELRDFRLDTLRKIVESITVEAL